MRYPAMKMKTVRLRNFIEVRVPLLHGRQGTIERKFNAIGWLWWGASRFPAFRRAAARRQAEPWISGPTARRQAAALQDRIERLQETEMRPLWWRPMALAIPEPVKPPVTHLVALRHPSQEGILYRGAACVQQHPGELVVAAYLTAASPPHGQDARATSQVGLTEFDLAGCGTAHHVARQ